MKTNYKKICISIDPKIHEKAKEKAKKDNRTLSNYLISLIIKDLDGGK